MSTFTKEFLSGSSNGRQILVAQTTTAGDLIHTVTSDADTKDEVWLYAENGDGSTRTLTIELGGTDDPDDLIEVQISPGDGLQLIVPGLVFDGGVVIRAFASLTNVIKISGYVNRIAP